MISIFFDCGWKSSSKLLDGYLKYTPHRKGVWQDIKGIYDLESADVVVHIGSYTGKTYSGKPVVQIRREPNFVEGFVKHPEAFAILDYDDPAPDGYHACTWEMELSFDELQNMDFPVKSRKASLISTDKWSHRNAIISTIAEAAGSKIDYFGIGLDNVISPELYKGQLNFPTNKCKMPGLKDYSYSIAIENSKQRNYFSEKVIDCYLGWSFPIYWGCPNLKEFFPGNCYYNLDELDSVSLNHILDQPLQVDQINVMKECRELVLNRYSLWPTLKRMIDTL